MFFKAGSLGSTTVQCSCSRLGWGGTLGHYHQLPGCSREDMMTKLKVKVLLEAGALLEITVPLLVKALLEVKVLLKVQVLQAAKLLLEVQVLLKMEFLLVVKLLLEVELKVFLESVLNVLHKVEVLLEVCLWFTLLEINVLLKVRWIFFA